MNETRLRDAITGFARLLYDRGLTHGTTGNISCRLDENSILVTPTGCCLGRLDPTEIARVDLASGTHDGPAPTKELPLHTEFYRQLPGEHRAVLHTHSLHCTAWSITQDVCVEKALPPVTAYQMMKCGHTPLIPYFPPGDPDLARAIGQYAATHSTLLLAAHGPVVSAGSVEDGFYILEELEATARLLLVLGNHRFNTLTDEQVAELESRFPS